MRCPESPLTVFRDVVRCPDLPVSLVADRVTFAAMSTMILAGMCYQGNFVILPIFLQDARGLAPGEVGLLVFLRPGMGFFAGLTLARLIKRPKAPLTGILRCGSIIYIFAWTILVFAAELPLEWRMLPEWDAWPILKLVVVLQLFFQSGSFFMMVRLLLLS